MSQPSRPVRIPELVLGLVLVVGCALAAVMWNRSVTAGYTIVVAANDVPRGSVIDEVDLVPAEVRGGDGVGFVSGEVAADLVGAVALVDIVAGEPFTSSMVTDTEPLTADEGLASLALERGQAPGDLGPGDSVRVVVVPVADPVTPTAPTLLELVAEVWDVEPPTEYEPEAVVTLRLPIADAAVVAGAESVRLVRVEP